MNTYTWCDTHGAMTENCGNECRPMTDYPGQPSAERQDKRGQDERNERNDYKGAVAEHTR